LDLITLVSQSVDESLSRDWSLLLLEILHLLLKFETPQRIWQTQADVQFSEEDSEMLYENDDNDNEEEEQEGVQAVKRMGQLAIASQLQKQLRVLGLDLDVFFSPKGRKGSSHLHRWKECRRSSLMLPRQSVILALVAHTVVY